MHPNFINTESVRLLRDTGCIDVDMGVESGSERIRKNVFHRTMTNRKMKEAVSLLKNAGIRVSTLNILGNPQEEYEDIIQTIKLNLDLKPSGMLFNVLYPFPKTLIYELCKNENMIDDEADHLIHEGYSSYRNKSLLKLKNWELIERLQIIVPILNKAPMFMWGFLLKIPPILLFRILSIPFLTSFHNARLKIYEFLIMVKKSYKKIRQIEAGRI
jgi:radical SAM superfamily enzyme YgiQ (UPF0313 family)